MKVTLPSPIAEAAQSRARPRAQGSDKKAFKSTLEKAEISLRKGEEMQAVEGHAYAEITKGDRKGLFVNTSGNVRHGQTFTVAHGSGALRGADGVVPAHDPYGQRAERLRDRPGRPGPCP